ncbi:MAG TPA: DUF6424 family protein [Streptosporangiaceae bacterium]|jgi:hypothetical protein
MTQSSGAAGSGNDHEEHEAQPWTINIPGHPVRSDSPEYVRSRKTMTGMADAISNLIYGAPPYEDHHGGGLWLKDAEGWFLVRNLAGMEWSSQFCADPAKVDLIRQNAKRLYAAFPQAAQELGIQQLLDTPITDAAGIAQWTDSICNASVPLPTPAHTGVLPTGGGVHHYPSPITEITFFKHDDFQLWVTDQEGHPAAVAPVSPRGAGDGRVHVIYATPGSHLAGQVSQAEAKSQPLILDSGHPLAQQAYAQQSAQSG